MKRIILTLSLISVLSLSVVSCSTDDSGLTNNDTTQTDFGTGSDCGCSGGADLPRPVPPKF
ncbi:hypothetical protein [Flavobacterium rhizosphaerae]|uniref:Lipoprotein n=1 Tax=Flavobacterium rhizosphaerae TaxID=3163298 RepID=A0ABW8YZ78_9FLAO